MKISKLISPKTQRGQGMSEYLIMVGVIAVGAIVVFGEFGGIVEDQVANATDKLSGATAGGTAGTVAATTGSNNSLNLLDEI